MCGSLQLTETEKLRTEAALRKILGREADRWTFGGALREEGVQRETDGKGEFLSWGGQKKRWAIEDVLSVPIEGFWDRSLATGRPLYFEAKGRILVPVYLDQGRIHFRYVSTFDRRVQALCRHDRAPLVAPRETEDPVAFLLSRTLVAA